MPDLMDREPVRKSRRARSEDEIQAVLRDLLDAMPPLPPKNSRSAINVPRGGLLDAGLGPVSRASRSGQTPESYAQSQGEISRDRRFEDFLTPAYQGVADAGALQVAPVISSGSKLYNDPSIPNATQFGIDSGIAMMPSAGLSKGAAVVAGSTAAGVGTAGYRDLLSPAEAKPKRKRQQPQEAPATVEASQPQESKGNDSFSSDPAIADLDRQISDLKSRADNGSIPRSTRMQYTQQISELQAKRTAKVEVLSAGQRPFRTAYPELNAMWPVVQGAAPAAVGAATKGVGDLLSAVRKMPWNAALRRGENAFEAGDIDKAVKAGNVVGRYHKDATEGWRSKLPEGGHTAPVIAGAVAGAETAAFPYQYDAKKPHWVALRETRLSRRYGLRTFWPLQAGVQSSVRLEVSALLI